MYKDDKLYNKLILAANEISKSSTRGGSNYIIAGNNIGKILKSQFYRTDRILKLEKIFKIIELLK